MEKRVALVTGASRGIGRAIAIGLAEQGANVIVNFRSHPDAAEGVVRLIKEVGGQAISIRADVAHDDEVKEMVKKAKEEFGGIDILVNNAALHRGGRIQKLAAEDWNLVINTV
jgi:3-oxoacyl-[acyl-carrier protein] reductase